MTEESFTSQSTVWMDVQERVQDEAVQNILFMTFCVFVSSFGAIIFNIDIYALIVEPLDAINRPWGIDSLNKYFHRSTLPSSV